MAVVRFLRWIDVDPATHPFDASIAEAIVEARLPAVLGRSPEHDDRRMLVGDAIDRALLAAYGPWIAGWRFAAESGGFVKSYCCSAHSLVGPRARVATRIVGAVREWRYRLEHLAREFDAIRRETGGKPIAEAVSWAAARLLPLVLEWTEANDAWYGTYERVLAWYLEPDVADPNRATAVVREAIGGRFHSWIEPSDEVRAAVIESVAEDVERELRDGPPVVDALDVWTRHREAVGWDRERLYAPDPVRRDGHRAYIESVDSVRDPVRAARMLRALEECRASARRVESLTFERLRAWQRLVLDADVDFRGAEAFAHGRTERYGLGPDTRARFEACLAQANDTVSSAVGRAARAYLDVCYFHPFPDGNARAARLALDHVLTRAGLALHTAEPVFLVARRALDLGGAYSFQYVVDYLAGAAHG